MVFMLVVVKFKWLFSVNVVEMVNVQLIILLWVFICFIMLNMGILFVRVVIMFVVVILFMFSSLLIFINGFLNQWVSNSIIGYVLSSMQEIELIILMVCIILLGLLSGVIKIGLSFGINFQFNRNLIIVVVRLMVISVIRNLVKIWKLLIIFFGMNFSFSVISIVIINIGIMFIRISVKVNFIG